MELLDQPAYSGPPPRYAVGATVYYCGLAYTVDRVCGRAPLVGWTYAIDGPGELLTVGEGEINASPTHPLHVVVDEAATMYATDPAIANGHTMRVFVNGQDVSQYMQGRAIRSIGLSSPPGPSWISSYWSNALGVSPALLTGQDVNYAAAQIQQDIQYMQQELERFRHKVTPRRSAADTVAALQAAATAPDRPTPRLSRRERRAKHRPWTPPKG